MSKKENGKSKIGTIVFIISIIILLTMLYNLYKTYYYNDFVKAEFNLKQSTFTKDSKVKYSNDRSYKLESKEYNDALFYKLVEVKPNTPYKITCMVKTENVEVENNSLDSRSTNRFSRFNRIFKEYYTELTIGNR